MKSEKPAILLALLALLARFALLALLAFVAACIAFVASLLLFVGFAWAMGCVVGGSFSLRTKRRRSAFVLRSVFTRFWCLYFKLSSARIASL